MRLDPDLFWRIFENLLDNAARFAPRGGRCTLSVRRDEAGLEIAIGNSGPPVPAEERDAIFGRFYQVEARRAAAREPGPRAVLLQARGRGARRDDPRRAAG